MGTEPKLSYVPTDFCLFDKFLLWIGCCYPCIRHGTPGAHISYEYVSGFFQSSSSCLRYCTPVYTYTITNYFQPQLLGNLLWYVLVLSAVAFFAHWYLTSQEPRGKSLLPHRFHLTHRAYPDRGLVQCEFFQCCALRFFLNTIPKSIIALFVQMCVCPLFSRLE